MPEFISGKQELIATLFEDLLFHTGILRIKKDGKGNANPLVYTRTYQVWLDNERISCEVKFVYDKRDDIADISVKYWDFMELKLQERLKGISNERIQVDESKRDTDYRPNGTVERNGGSEGSSQLPIGIQKLKGKTR